MSRMDHRFDKAARTYDAFAQVQRAMADWLAEWIPAERTGSAIEIGAGTGLFTRHLRPWSESLRATDLSGKMVGTGMKKYPEIEWMVRDAGKIEPETYDWIFSCSFLQWSESPQTLLELWRRSLVPGGKVLAGFFIEGALVELNRILGDEAPVPRRDWNDWRRIFSRAGFRILSTEVRATHCTYASSLELFRHLHRIGATGKPRLNPSGMKKLLNTYTEACGIPGGGVKATWKYCRLLAER